MQQKKAMRADMAALLNAQNEAIRDAAAEAACTSLQGLSCAREAGVIGVYLALRTELSVDGFAASSMKKSVQIAAPLFEPNAPAGAGALMPRFAALSASSGLEGLQVGTGGVRLPPPGSEEVGTADIDVLLVPGLAFDGEGYRLGRGGGWYDRVLASLRPGAIAIGLCFDFQLVARVPREAHDRAVNMVVTPSRVIVDTAHAQSHR